MPIRIGKRLFSFFMVLAIVLFMLPLNLINPLNVSAEEIDSATGLKYEVESGEAIITGFEKPGGFDGELEIPTNLSSYEVIAIEASAFSYCTDLTSITLPTTIISIANYAFQNCSNLTSITMPSGVEIIGDGVFQSCSSLTSITFPGSVTSIGTDMFTCCDNLTSIEVNESNNAYCDINGVLCNKDKTIIYAYLPGNTSTSYTVPNGITTIEIDAFYQCENLTDIVLLDGVTTIKSGAFACCSSLESITIPSSVTSIADDAFLNCDDMSIQGEEGSYAQTYATNKGIPFAPMPSAGSEGKYEKLTYKVIDGEVIIIGCESTATTVVIPSEIESCPVTIIADFAFQCCTSMTSISMPSSVEYIGKGAFAECTSLTSIIIPKSVEEMGYGVFTLCSSLTSIKVDENNVYYCDIDGVLFDADKSVIYTYPAGNTSTSYTIPNDVVSIADSAFYKCTYLTSVSMPNSIEEIGESAFAYCSNLESITIPTNVITIGEIAFAECTSLTSVTIMSSDTSIGDGAFSNNSLGLIIYGKSNSPAETYANSNGITFICTDGWFVVTFFSNPNTIISQIEVDGGEKIPEPEYPKETGYVFKGWYKESDCINLWDFETDTVTQVTDLFAKWEEDTTAPSTTCVTDGKTYYAEQRTIYICDDNIDTIKVNGISKNVTGTSTQIILPANNTGSYNIVATDTAGNVMNITVWVLSTWVRDGISSNGTKELVSGTEYKLGSGSWTISGDTTVYSGEITFYIGQAGTYSFTQK